MSGSASIDSRTSNVLTLADGVERVHANRSTIRSNWGVEDGRSSCVCDEDGVLVPVAIVNDRLPRREHHEDMVIIREHSPGLKILARGSSCKEHED